MLPINTSRSSLLTQLTTPSERTQESTGSFPRSKTEENSEDLPQLVRNIEVSDRRVTELMDKDHPEDLTTNSEPSTNGEEVEYVS